MTDIYKGKGIAVFGNKPPGVHRIFEWGWANARRTKWRVSMIEYLQVLVLSNCVLTVAHTIDILGLYMN